MPRVAYVNGRFGPLLSANIHVEDRGVQFADSVYEVVALINGHVADERGHLERLQRSLKELRIAMPMSISALRIVMRELIRRNRILNGGIYIQISRGIAPRDFKFPKEIKSSLIMTLRPADFDMTKRKSLLKKAISVPDIRWQRRDIKTTALVAQVLARQAALDLGAHDAWFVDDDGYITEAAASNAWIVTNRGELLTRSTQNNVILKGVTRSTLQSLCRKERINIVERPFSLKEAYKAREAFTTSAVALIQPIIEIDGYKIGTGKLGSITEKIMDLYMASALSDFNHQISWSPK